MFSSNTSQVSDGGPIYVDDVFSTWLYTGNGSTQTINNGIDLAGKGGMTWIKSRSETTDNFLFDTSRGVLNEINSNNTIAQQSLSGSLTAFNSNGFSIGNAAGINVNAATYASWTFRKEPKFFDVVTYTGNGVNRTIPHNLGSVPGCIMVKQTNASQNWRVWHRSMGGNQFALVLNTTAGIANTPDVWNSTAPTATEFSVGTSIATNENGGTYVAYLFAHDAGGFGATGNDNVISCGSFTGNGARQEVNLGWEPQWLLIKRTDGIGDWRLYDTMRGWATGSSWNPLFPNLGSAEGLAGTTSEILPTGFSQSFGTSSFIYIAIRRPMKPPTSGTSVFDADYTTGGGTSGKLITTNFPVDASISSAVILSGNATTSNRQVFDRLRGSTRGLRTNATDAESTLSSAIGFASNTAIFDQFWNTTVTAIYWNFRRAPGFFDVVCYTGTGVARTVEHNLGVAPELMIVKQRNTAQDWLVYAAPLGNNKALYLNFTDASTTRTEWNNTTPTSSVFSVSTNVSVNQSGGTYVAYLFASAAGISKVGSYTGNGTSQTIDCGFAAGARFVLIKRTNTTGNWVTFDTARGIVSGNDPALYLNSNAAEVTSIDGIDPDSSGFIVNQESTFNLNVNGASYIYLSVA